MEMTTQPSEQQVEKTETIDDIAKEFRIETQEEVRQQPAPQPQPQYQTPPQQAIEPPESWDTEAHKRYLQNLAAGQTTLQSALHQTLNKLNSFEQKAQKAALEADISKAVEAVKDKVGLDKDIIEVSLDLRARKDPKFRAIWENRAKNPEALNRSLNVIAKELEQKFSVKADPNLQNAQRALKLSQSQMATTKESSPAEEWDGLGPDEFARKWAQSVSGGY